MHETLNELPENVCEKFIFPVEINSISIRFLFDFYSISKTVKGIP